MSFASEDEDRDRARKQKHPEGISSMDARAPIQLELEHLTKVVFDHCVESARADGNDPPGFGSVTCIVGSVGGIIIVGDTLKLSPKEILAQSVGRIHAAFVIEQMRHKGELLHDELMIGIATRFGAAVANEVLSAFRSAK